MTTPQQPSIPVGSPPTSSPRNFAACPSQPPSLAQAKAGAASAAKSVLKGFVGGMVTLVAAPVIGAKEQGAKGFVKGLGAGVFSAVALPVAGLVVGGVQLARGMANTPNAIAEERKGR